MTKYIQIYLDLYVVTVIHGNQFRQKLHSADNSASLIVILHSCRWIDTITQRGKIPSHFIIFLKGLRRMKHN
jgi:hypothetical protein